MYFYPMNKKLIIIGAFTALIAVVIGAFGAHGLKTVLNPTQLNTFEIGVRYQFYHSFAILLSGILFFHFPSKNIITAGWFFLLGILLFSGSLYLLACREFLGIEGWTFLGPLTPIGGIFFILGWGMIIVGVGTSKSLNR